MKKLINGRRLGLVRRQVRPIGPVMFQLMATFPNGTRVYMGLEAVEWSAVPPTTQHVYEYWQKGR